jgi:hypothetical protein
VIEAIGSGGLPGWFASDVFSLAETVRWIIGNQLYAGSWLKMLTGRRRLQRVVSETGALVGAALESRTVLAE